MFDKEEVSEEEAKQYAKKKGLDFQVTSALSGVGIEELFYNTGKKLVDPNFKLEDEEENDNDENKKTGSGGRITLEAKVVQEDNKKKFCCSYF